MFYPPFWILLTVSLILLGITFLIKKPAFIDFLVYITIVAMGMSLDMLICKQFAMYHYVAVPYIGWYSFWANIIIIPSLGSIYVKFLPLRPGHAAIYTTIWVAANVLFETYVIKPTGIVMYMKWKIIPYSLIGTTILFIILYLYRNMLLRITNQSYRGKANS